MPRKSFAELTTVVPFKSPQLPEPPDHLTAEQAEHWNRIVRAMPPDWFSRQSEQDLLAIFCLASSSFRHLNQLIEACDKNDISRYDRLLKMRERESRLMLHAATKCRMTHQSRWQASTANSKLSSPAEQPWGTVK
jgi:hypothetical protein